MGSYFKAIILILVLLFLITFGVKNSQTVLLSYYFGVVDIGIPLYALVYLSVVIGILVGMIVGLQTRLTLRRRVKILERENIDLKEKVRVEDVMELSDSTQEEQSVTAQTK
jgi:uncharacterized integral membrane protein